MRFLDTDIMIDLLRGYVPAVQWFKGLDEEAVALPGYVVMELLMGCLNQPEVTSLYKILHPFWVYWPSEGACNNAMVGFAERHLSHNLGILDALIGECAIEQGAALCTFNQKHYEAIDGLITQQPYSKD